MNVWVSAHAADRFAERVRPGLDRKAAQWELRRLLLEFGRRVEWPAWCHALDGAQGWAVEVSDGVIVICEEDSRRPGRVVAITVKTRGGRGPDHEHRGQRRRAHRRGRRVARVEPRPARRVLPGFED